MNHKEDILQWILELEAYAKAQELSMRILDSIEDCKQNLYKEDLSWQEIMQQLDEVMESMELKAQQTDLATYGRNKNNVSVEKVQTKVQRMAEDCHRENLNSAAAIAEKKNLNVKECIRKMEEISHTEAHFDEMIDESRYVDFFQKVKNSYNRDMAKTVDEMINDIHNNYDHMVDHMKSMFQSIRGYMYGIGNETFYREYESRNDGIRGQMISEVHTTDFGGSVIMEFPEKTKETMQKNVKRNQLKKKIFAILPLILTILLIASITIALTVQIMKIGNAINENEVGKTVSKIISDIAEKKGIQINDISSLPSIVIAGGIFELIVTSTFFIIYIIIYIFFYLKMLKKWCNRRICEDCGTYLRTELAAFERENKLTQKADEAISQIVEDCEQQYLTILNNIFAGTKYEEKDTEEVSGFDDLQRKWNKLKYN